MPLRFLRRCTRAILRLDRLSAGFLHDTRQLTDGREFNIIKVNHDLTELSERLDALGWDVVVKPVTSNTYSVFGKLH